VLLGRLRCWFVLASCGYPSCFVSALLARTPGCLLSGSWLSLCGDCPPQFRQVAMAAGMFNTLGRTPYAFMTFGRCTPARGRGALPYFRSVLPAECNPLRGLESINCVGSVLHRLSLTEALSD
jgi:hypothetical protein